MGYMCPLCLQWNDVHFSCSCDYYEDEPIRMDGLTDYEFWQSRQDDSFGQMFQEQIQASIEQNNEKEWEKENQEVRAKLKVSAGMQLNVKGGKGYTREWRGAKFCKRLSNRAMRRAAKQDPENAPTRFNFIGWTW